MKTEDRLKKCKYTVASFYTFSSIIDHEILLIKEQLTFLATNQEIKLSLIHI